MLLLFLYLRAPVNIFPRIPHASIIANLQGKSHKRLTQLIHLCQIQNRKTGKEETLNQETMFWETHYPQMEVVRVTLCSVKIMASLNRTPL